MLKSWIYLGDGHPPMKIFFFFYGIPNDGMIIPPLSILNPLIIINPMFWSSQSAEMIEILLRNGPSKSPKSQWSGFPSPNISRQSIRARLDDSGVICCAVREPSWDIQCQRQVFFDVELVYVKYTHEWYFHWYLQICTYIYNYISIF
jgi:hypothetical protein